MPWVITEAYDKQLKRLVSRRVWKAEQRPAPVPPPATPVIPKPPTPDVGDLRREREERLRLGRRRRRAPSPAEQIRRAIETAAGGAPPGDIVDLGVFQEVMGRAGELYGRAVARRDPTSLQSLLDLLGRSMPIQTVRGLGESFGPLRDVLPESMRGLVPEIDWGQVPLGGGLGGMQMPTAAEQARKKAAGQPFTNIYAGQEPTELWFLREGLGGRAGRAGEIWKAWAGGGRPLFVPKSVAGILRVDEDQMREAGYERTLGGSWRVKDAPRPALQPPPSYGGSYGYTPSRYGRGGGGVRGQAAARGMGLINWRIGL